MSQMHMYKGSSQKNSPPSLDPLLRRAFFQISKPRFAPPALVSCDEIAHSRDGTHMAESVLIAFNGVGRCVELWPVHLHSS